MNPMLTMMTAMLGAVMNDCSSSGSSDVFTLYEHGIVPRLPVRGDPLKRWLEFYMPEDISLDNLTFRSTIIRDGEVAYTEDIDFCDEINCNYTAGDIIRYSDYWDTHSTTLGSVFSHIIEIVDDDNNNLLCSEAYIRMHPFEDRLEKLSNVSYNI
jgi:hypothetical protein